MEELDGHKEKHQKGRSYDAVRSEVAQKLGGIEGNDEAWAPMRWVF